MSAFPWLDLPLEIRTSILHQVCRTCYRVPQSSHKFHHLSQISDNMHAPSPKARPKRGPSPEDICIPSSYLSRLLLDSFQPCHRRRQGPSTLSLASPA